MDFFRQLLLVSVGRLDRLERPLSADEWEEIFKMSKKQALIGVFEKAVMSLPEDQIPPQKIKVRYAIIEDKVREKNLVLCKHVTEVSNRMKSFGFDSCILKGQGVARLYPDPGSRQSGDIDVWVRLEDSHHGLLRRPSRKVPPLVRNLRRHWKVGEIVYHHADVYMFEDGTSLEVHFMPTWMFNPLFNRRLQHYFDSQADRQFSNIDPVLGVAVPTVDFNCVYMLLHIFRHFLFEGVGLRQLMDYYYLLLASNAQQRKDAYEFLCSLSLGRFCAGLMYCLKEYFSLDDEYLLCPVDEKLGAFLMSEVDQAGNFGVYDSRNVSISRKTPLKKRFIYRFKHLSRFYRLSIREVAWGPVFKIWQYLWRSCHRY